MGTAELIIENFYRRYGLQSSEGTEYYLAEGLFQADLDDPSTITGLPVRGGLMSGDIPVQDVAVVQVFDQLPPYRAIFVVRGYTLSGTLIPYRSTTAFDAESSTTLEIPIFEQSSYQYSDQAGGLHTVNYFFEKDPAYFQRPVFYLAYTSVVWTTLGALESFNGANQGKRYVRTTGTQYLFIAANGIELPSGQWRVTGKWRTTAPHPAIPAATYSGQDVALPALGPLDEYTHKVNPGSTPTVGVLPITRIPAGATYPF